MLYLLHVSYVQYEMSSGQGEDISAYLETQPEELSRSISPLLLKFRALDPDPHSFSLLDPDPEGK